MCGAKQTKLVRSIPMVDHQPLASTNVAELVPPEIRHRNRQTDTNRDLDYTYIWAKDWAEWTLGKPRSPSRIVCCLVKNSVLALGSSKKIGTRSIHVGGLSKVSKDTSNYTSL